MMMLHAILIFLGVIDVVVIGLIVGSEIPLRIKLLWSFIVVVLPIAGPVFYFLYGDAMTTR
ncbi:hypothetical protein IT570_12545 [Candidatus Sumerlaeota bacterium]|nr:hypothetical protein [Candidatus Sumerlaeota bacterium]